MEADLETFVAEGGLNPGLNEPTNVPPRRPLAEGPIWTPEQEQPTPDDNHFSTAVIVMLWTLVVLLIFYLAYYKAKKAKEPKPVKSPLRRSVSDRSSVSFRTVAADIEHVDRRYETIEGWLVSKRVQPHDKYCKRCIPVLKLRDTPAPPRQMPGRNKSFVSVATFESSGNIFAASTKNECSICTGAIVVGDVVSFSINNKCHHIFHHECIKVRVSM